MTQYPDRGRSLADKQLATMLEGVERASSQIDVLEAKRAARLDDALYERIYHETLRGQLRRLRFIRPMAASNDLMCWLARTAGWTFRQPVAAGEVGFLEFGIEVETVAHPKEALLTLQRATGKEFRVEEIWSRPAGFGEGEGPRLPCDGDSECSYEDSLKAEYCFDATSEWAQTGLGAKRICHQLDILLTRLANYVDVGAFPTGTQQELPTPGGARPVRVRTWKSEEVEQLRLVLTTPLEF